MSLHPRKGYARGEVKYHPSPMEKLSFPLRIGGCLVVFSVGSIVTNSDAYNSEDFIYPLGYSATRIFWSATRPRARTVWR